MRRSTPPEQATHSRSCSELIRGHVRPQRHRLSARCYQEVLAGRFAVWRRVTATGLTSGI